ncbi:2'-5' RNA ligase family protein [Nesterenkonia suensis]
MSLAPPEGVLEHLDDALASVQAMLPPEAGNGPPALRWVPTDLRHITLAFYGELPAGAVDDLTMTLREVVEPQAPLEVRLRGAGVFASRTLWAGVQDQAPSTHSRRNGPLADLMAACEQAGRAAGSTVERPERRRAHLTLARVRGRAGATRGQGAQGHGARGRPRRSGGDAAERLHLLADALAVYEGPLWTAEEAQLMVSELGAGAGGGPRHEVLTALPLTG